MTMNEKFTLEAAGAISMAVCGDILRNERGNGTIKDVLHFNGEFIGYTVRYYLWLNPKNGDASWQAEVTLPKRYDGETVRNIENAITDIVNDYISVGNVDIEKSILEEYKEEY